MADLGKQDFFGGSEAEMGSRSFPNLQSFQTIPDSVEMPFNTSHTIESLLNPTKITQFNGQQYGPPAGTRSDLTEGEGYASRTSTPNTIPDKATRKKEIDKAYRERQKQGKMQMKSELGRLNGENANLKNENKSLRREIASMTQNLQVEANEMSQLKSKLHILKCEHKKENVLVQILSQQLADSDLHHENERLTFENAQLRQNVSLDYRTMQLAEENARLKSENRKLRVQNDALCGKIINDNDTKYA